MHLVNISCKSTFSVQKVQDILRTAATTTCQPAPPPPCITIPMATVAATMLHMKKHMMTCITMEEAFLRLGMVMNTRVIITVTTMPTTLTTPTPTTVFKTQATPNLRRYTPLVFVSLTMAKVLCLICLPLRKSGVPQPTLLLPLH